MRIKEIIDNNIERIPKLRRQGLTEQQIAQVLGISVASLTKYKKSYAPLSDALQKGKEQLIEDLEDSLYKKALGLCKVTTTKKYINRVPDKTSAKGYKDQTRIEETTQTIPPDTGALVFSLKNLEPSRWRDNPDFSFSALQNKLDNLKSFSEKAEELEKECNDVEQEESPL